MPSESPTPNIQPEGVALGTIFKYPGQISDNQFRNWARELNYTFGNISDGVEVTSGPRGMQIQGSPRNLGQREDGFQMIYNNSGNIVGFGDCSFVTVKDIQGARFETVSDDVANLWVFLEESNIKNQIDSLEMTLEARIQFDSPAPLTKFYRPDVIDNIESFAGNSAKGVTAQFHGDFPPSKDGWFRLLFDMPSTNNPTVWQMRFMKRYSDLESIEHEGMVDQIEEYIRSVMAND